LGFSSWKAFRNLTKIDFEMVQDLRSQLKLRLDFRVQREIMIAGEAVNYCIVIEILELVVDMGAHPSIKGGL
jgi:hypothetical protein